MNFLKNQTIYTIYSVVFLAIAACTPLNNYYLMKMRITEFKPTFDIQKVWKVRIGESGPYFFSPVAINNTIYVTSTNGEVRSLDAETGKLIWCTKLDIDYNLSSGIGSDGNIAAISTLKGDVFVLGSDGKQLWKTNVQGEILSSPLVGNGFIIIRKIDGEVIAFLSKTGEKKWQYRSRAMPLNLRVPVGMKFIDNVAAVLVGFPGGELAAIKEKSGETLWKTSVSLPKGITEVERINDVIGTPTFFGTQVCAATFQGKIGCFDMKSGRRLWERIFSSHIAPSQDASALIGIDNDSIITAYDARTGNILWQSDKLKGQNIGGAPIIFGQVVVVTDYQGYIHFISRKDGAYIMQIETDGSPITTEPILLENMIIVQTNGGNLYSFRKF